MGISDESVSDKTQ